jgi:hypothetical protein
MAPTSVARSLIGLVLVAVATGAAFFGWLGRDTTKTLDPLTGHESGPWSTGQVAGCLLTLLVVLVAAVLLGVPALVAAAAMTVSFVLAWTATAAASDDSGMFAVGAVLVLIGMAIGTTVVALLTARLARN